MSKAKKRMRAHRRTLALALVLPGLAILLLGWLLDRGGWGAVNAKTSDALLGLRISEVQNHNVLTLRDGEGAPAWVELENAGEASVSLKGVCLTRDEKLNKTLVFPDIELQPGEFLLVYADGKGVTASDGTLHAPFRLSKSGSHELYLYDAAQRLLDSVSLPVTQADESLCRDGGGAWTVTAEPTPGRSNAVAGERGEAVREGDVALNEAMTANLAVFPDENGEYPDYVELLNRTDRAVSLEGYWLSDNPAKPDKWRFPAISLPAGGVLAVHCSGEDRRSDPNHLHAAFKLSKGETVYLSQPDGVTVSTLTLPELQAGQAVSRTAEGWVTSLPPTPNRENTLDAALALDGEGRALRAGGVYISEVMALPETEKSDWVELYNSGDDDVDLSGWGLSDRLSHARKWQFPAGTTLAARSYLAVFMVGKDGSAPAGYLSAPFALNAEGGFSICLSDAAGNLRDNLFLPQQYSGISFGRDDGGACGYFLSATPLASNGAQALLGPAAGAAYSTPGGLHASGESFQVSLSAGPGARIYYTLDCSDPDESKALYDGAPIPVSGTTILRTRVYEEGRLPSLMDTQSYLYDVSAAGEAPYVVSLVSDPVGLYSDETGIMVMGPNATDKFPYGDTNKGANFWMDWEREAHVELFTADGQTAISQECGIKLHGRNTRAYELKCFKVMAKSCYGSNRFRYPIFKDRPWDEYEAFILRYSGQDYKYAFMRDAVLTGQAANTSVMYMEAMECVCYLNGEYYSAMYIRENISPFSLARREGWTGQEASVDLVKSGYEVKQGSNESYIALKAYLDSTDNASPEVYERIAAEVDIDNFIQFATMYVVYCPPDTVNVKRYRNPDADGKWRWVLYDLDRGMRGGEEYISGFELMAQGTNAQLFRAFMVNEPLRERFLAHLNEALSTYLSSQSLTDAVTEQFERIRPLLPQYLEKMGVSQNRYKSSLKVLLANVRNRPAKVLEECSAYLGLSPEEMQTRFAEAYAAIEAFGK